ncbi:MAG: PadR family transcriptional regulator [Mycobacterium sp.]|nr:PadR family transcriptional regulator [Mycobacterium sp.]
MSKTDPDSGEHPSLNPNGWTVLGIVSYSKELSGYQVKKWADFGPGFFNPSPSFSQVYNELKRLEDLGLVSSREALADETNARNRRLYRITPAGERALTNWAQNAPVDRAVLKHPMLMRVMLGSFNQPDKLKSMLAEHIERAELQSHQAAHYAQFAANDPYFAYVWVTLRWSERYYAAERTLAIELLKDIDLAAERFSKPAVLPDWFEAPMFPAESDEDSDGAPPNTGRVR